MSGSPAAAAWASRRLPRGPRGLSRPPPRAAALRASPPARARPRGRGLLADAPGDLPRGLQVPPRAPGGPSATPGRGVGKRVRRAEPRGRRLGSGSHEPPLCRETPRKHTLCPVPPLTSTPAPHRPLPPLPPPPPSPPPPPRLPPRCAPARHFRTPAAARRGSEMGGEITARRDPAGGEAAPAPAGTPHAGPRDASASLKGGP